ncbi:MAG: hypothetical protein GY820_43905, partial [Gammaproteobacteria bacterium]|nr:hypothetical protein [Gammaproteobacteria bacterium]
MPNFMTQMHMEHLIFQHAYLEEMMMEVPGMRTFNRKGRMVVNQRDMEYWESKNAEYYAAPELSEGTDEDKARYESQWRTDAKAEAVEIATSPRHTMHDQFTAHCRREGNANGCAMLLFYVYHERGGLHMKVSPEQFELIQTAMLDMARQQQREKQPLTSPSGEQVERQLGLIHPKKKPKTPKKKKKKELKFTDKVTTKPFHSDQKSSKVGQAGGTMEERMRGMTTTDPEDN